MQRTGKNETAVDDLLIDLQREKKEVEDKLEALTEREKQLHKLIKSYEELHRDLEYRRKKFKLEAKEKALQDVARDNRELERLVREIREQQNLDKAKELVQQQRQVRKQAEESVRELQAEIHETPPEAFKSAKTGDIQPGDFVKLRNGGANGNVESLKVLEDFLDRALLTSVNHLRIVHGKGTGVLRNIVRTKLREYREMKQAYHPVEEEGGDGVTLVEF